jgi:hypothetical protein
MYLATPLYLETPLEKPLLFLREHEIENVKCLNNGETGKIKTDVISYLLSEARYSSFVRVSIILSSFS